MYCVVLDYIPTYYTTKKLNVLGLDFYNFPILNSKFTTTNNYCEALLCIFN